MTKPTIIVTGAAGFIGSHASQELIRRGWRVVGIDNFSPFYDRAWKEQNLKAIGPDIDLQEMDITDAAAVKRVFAAARPTAVLHLAAMAGVRPSIAQPALYCRVNVEGTTNLLQAAVDHHVGKFLFASSSSVYGNNSKVPFSVDDEVAAPISPYAATKRAGELICHTYWHLHKLPIFCLRFFTVYGPRQRPDLAIHKFTRLIDAGKSIPVFGDGSTSRDYTFVADIVAGIMGALDRCDRFGIYNLGGSDPVTLARLIEEIEKAVGKKAIIDRRPAQPGDVERTYADVSHSRRDLGYSPSTPISEGLRQFVAWYREVGHLYPMTL
jgi:UDP-glucuronate 4-epimerase